jgi:uncharacterized protein with GYD domain
MIRCSGVDGDGAPQLNDRTCASGPVHDLELEFPMSLYLVRAQYTPEALKGLMSRPTDREAAGREIFEALGMKMHHIWYSPKGEIVCIAEGGAVNGASVAMVITASGGLCNATVEELLTTQQQVEAMKAAGEVAAKYRAPGASATSK